MYYDCICVETNLFKMKDFIKLLIKSCLVHSILYFSFQNNTFSSQSKLVQLYYLQN